MKIQKTRYAGVAACKLTHGKAEMIVLTGVGPRIISLRLDGSPNILYEHEGTKPNHGKWRIYGGHRIWVAPESEVCYEPDNAPCTVEVKGNCLRVLTPISPMRLQKGLEIRAAGPGVFALRTTLANHGPGVAYGALWMLTCVVPQGRLIAPWGSGTPDWRMSKLVVWNHWNDTTTDLTSEQWNIGNGRIVVEPTGEFGKIGIYSDAGWIGLLRKDLTFVKSFDPIAGKEYPDDGCNVEMYTCPNFMEMETLTPIGQIDPGQTIVHDERWTLSPRAFAPGQLKKIGALGTK
jgi:hypothetical protein